MLNFYLPFEIYSLDSHWFLQSSHLLKMSRKKYWTNRQIHAHTYTQNFLQRHLVQLFPEHLLQLNQTAWSCGCPIKANVWNPQSHQAEFVCWAIPPETAGEGHHNFKRRQLGWQHLLKWWVIFTRLMVLNLEVTLLFMHECMIGSLNKPHLYKFDVNQKYIFNILIYFTSSRQCLLLMKYFKTLTNLHPQSMKSHPAKSCRLLNFAQNCWWCLEIRSERTPQASRFQSSLRHHFETDTRTCDCQRGSDIWDPPIKSSKNHRGSCKTSDWFTCKRHTVYCNSKAGQPMD